MPEINIQEILRYLPHRYPFLLVDRILDLEEGKRCVGLKNVTMNEPFFQGHYPGYPIMPGVLIIEAIAQAGALVVLTDERYKDMVPVIGSVSEVRFRRPVVPGDQLISDTELLWVKSGVGKMRGTARVNNEEVASLEMTFMMIPRAE